MRIQKTKTLLSAIGLGVSLFAQVPAKAVNPNYAAGDLVLAFQQEGGANTVYVSLGSATTYRGADTGVDVANIINIININAQLTAAFGANWATSANLYAGLSGVASTSTGTALNAGDPGRTLYVSAARADAGTVGEANSAGWEIGSNSDMTFGANGMVAQNSVLADAAGTNGYTTAAVVSPTSVSQIDNQNPFLGAGVQGTAFQVFDGGVQQVGTAGSFGTYGPVANVEFALDLYRIQARDDIAGQVGQGQGVRTGSYEGTIVLDASGNVSFVSAVPEPTTCALLAGGLTVLMTFRRRRGQPSQA